MQEMWVNVPGTEKLSMSIDAVFTLVCLISHTSSMERPEFESYSRFTKIDRSPGYYFQRLPTALKFTQFTILVGGSISAMRLDPLTRSDGIKLNVAEIFVHIIPCKNFQPKQSWLVSLDPIASISGANRVSRRKRVFADEVIYSSLIDQAGNT